MANGILGRIGELYNGCAVSGQTGSEYILNAEKYSDPIYSGDLPLNSEILTSGMRSSVFSGWRLIKCPCGLHAAAMAAFPRQTGRGACRTALWRLLRGTD